MITKLHVPTTRFVAPALLLFTLQGPIMPSLPEILKSKAVYKADAVEQLAPQITIADEFFGSDTKNKNAIIERQVEFVSTRKAYPASYAVVAKHAETIKNFAAQKQVPEDVAIGVALLENGGSETAVSPAGALGVFQLMPGTAKSLGLTVNKQHDDRRDPMKNIEAGVRYLASNYQRFGDWGLATWAYHAGEGNVSKALKIYARANHGIELKGVKDAAGARAYVEKYGITIHKLLSDPAVKKFTQTLNDDSSGYPYKVIATATLFKKGQAQAEAKPKGSVRAL